MLYFVSGLDSCKLKNNVYVFIYFFLSFNLNLLKILCIVKKNMINKLKKNYLCIGKKII